MEQHKPYIQTKTISISNSEKVVSYTSRNIAEIAIIRYRNQTRTDENTKNIHMFLISKP